MKNVYLPDEKALLHGHVPHWHQQSHTQALSVCSQAIRNIPGNGIFFTANEGYLSFFNEVADLQESRFKEPICGGMLEPLSARCC